MVALQPAGLSEVDPCAARAPGGDPVDLFAVFIKEQDDVLRRRRLLARERAEDLSAAAGCGRPAAAAHPRADRAAEPAGRDRSGPTPVDPHLAYLARAHELGDLSALRLSGCGIRSAAFALGILQGLARCGLLHQFDYLSTVSGGGYIGGWLTAWIHRYVDGYGGVVAELPANREPQRDSPLAHLWRYSSYLTPRRGALSADTLTAAILYVRNLLLN